MHRMLTRLSNVSRFVHHHLIWFLLGSYAIAAIAPAPGLWIKNVSFGQAGLMGQHVNLSLPLVLLSCLLLNAGLGVDLAQIGGMLRGWRVLALGAAANLFVPIAFIFLVTQIMRLWHNPDEVQNILVGLALVASMPIAGSSAAWSQNANGSLALSLGLVLATTLLSPLTTPLALHSVGLMTNGDYSQDLHELASQGAGAFLAVAVFLPSVLGIGIRASFGAQRVNAVRPHLKLINSAILLALNYSNASISLPQAIANPDWDFVAAILVITLSLCATAFGSGWLVAQSLKVDASARTALMFGLGMNNNGSGLVLATMALADHPRVMLPIIFYNLVQHLVAGWVDRAISRPGRLQTEPEPAASEYQLELAAPRSV
ncbi:MAG TPA: bile acid:sodium symporter [Pirellulales bacterium]|nr:bile acid:sodium symporter [Pirellulales bacterium]